MLRSAVAAKTKIGLIAKEIMARGDLVSDDVILEIVEQRVQEPDCTNGVLFDGFPRTIAQAEGLNDIGLSIHAVIELSVSDEEVVRRISGRRVHEPSGRVYHLTFDPPKVAGRDDQTGEALIQRVDDREETVKERLAVYQRQTAPLIEFYQNSNQAYHRVDGEGDPESILAHIQSCLRSLQASTTPN